MLARHTFRFQIPNIASRGEFFTATADTNSFRVRFNRRQANHIGCHRVTAFYFIACHLEGAIYKRGRSHTIQCFTGLLGGSDPALARTVSRVTIVCRFIASVCQYTMGNRHIFGGTSDTICPNAGAAQINRRSLRIAPPIPSQFPTLRCRGRQSTQPTSN